MNSRKDKMVLCMAVALIATAAWTAAQLKQVLHGDIAEDQCPGDVVLRVKRVPVGAGTLCDKEQQEHIGKDKDVLPDAVSAVDVDVVGRVVPDLDDREGAEDIGKKAVPFHKAALGRVQQGVIPADDVDENQVVNQLKILDLLFFLFEQIR